MSKNGEGVPISAIIFGGRRSDTMPLVFQALDWEHGVYLGATMASETTAAATGAVGQVRRDPMAMLPFCGYNMGDYFQHWLEIGPRLTNPPLIFHVNWFRKDADGKFLWPGFGDNMRVLEMDHRSLRRQRRRAKPRSAAFRARRISISTSSRASRARRMRELFSIKPEEWKKELEGPGEFFESLGQDMPQELLAQREKLAEQFAK